MHTKYLQKHNIKLLKKNKKHKVKLKNISFCFHILVFLMIKRLVIINLSLITVLIYIFFLIHITKPFWFLIKNFKTNKLFEI